MSASGDREGCSGSGKQRSVSQESDLMQGWNSIAGTTALSLLLSRGRLRASWPNLLVLGTSSRLCTADLGWDWICCPFLHESWGWCPF